MAPVRKRLLEDPAAAEHGLPDKMDLLKVAIDGMVKTLWTQGAQGASAVCDALFERRMLAKYLGQRQSSVLHEFDCRLLVSVGVCLHHCNEY